MHRCRREEDLDKQMVDTGGIEAVSSHQVRCGSVARLLKEMEIKEGTSVSKKKQDQ